MKTLLPICLILGSLAMLIVVAHADSRDWTLLDTRGQNFNLLSASGSPKLLVFWATWCVPCKKELADHRELFNEYERRGVQVLLISEDTPKTQAKVKPYVDARGITWRVLLDPDGQILKRYGGVSLPYAVLLDGDGSPVQKIRGALKNTTALTAEIEKLLRSPK